jgi:hypothetical protein
VLEQGTPHGHYIVGLTLSEFRNVSAQKLGLGKREARPVDRPNNPRSLTVVKRSARMDLRPAGIPSGPQHENSTTHSRARSAALLALPQPQSTPSSGPGTRPRAAGRYALRGQRSIGKLEAQALTSGLGGAAGRRNWQSKRAAVGEASGRREEGWRAPQPQVGWRMLGRLGGGSETLGGDEEDFNLGQEEKRWRGPVGIGRGRGGGGSG